MIDIIYKFPVVLTKDVDFIKDWQPVVEEGGIVLLPEDAVLVVAPDIQVAPTPKGDK